MKPIHLFSKIALFIIVTCSSAQVAATNSYLQNNEDLGLFSSDEILEVVVTADIKSLLKSKQDDGYQEGAMSINGKDYSVRLKTKGAYQQENCSFPPITLNFSKTNFEDQSFVQLEKLKIVSACEMQQINEQYILREYLIYRVFNQLTDKSLKVRLLKIDFVDSKGKFEAVTRYGFVVEDEYMMVRRLNGMILKSEGIQEQATNKKQIVMLSIFQFMIGNTDWQVDRLQNVNILKINEASEVTPYVIPFDFDYSGMVNASYATPSPVLGIKSFRERIYLGKCYTEEELKNTIGYFIQKRETIYTLYNQFEPFDESSLNQSIDFLDSFYKIIQDEKSWKNYFVSNCKP